MSNTAWQAFYFHGFDNLHPPARTELIEAPSEEDAAKLAESHMGDCKRVIRRKLSRREEPQEVGLNIYPMMDMMTILLVFLIMSFASGRRR